MNKPECKISPNGHKQWFLNKERHREDGPAIEYADGTKTWYLNDKRHREDGPAFESPNGYKEWWLDGECLTEEEHAERVNPPCSGKVVEIDGVKYKLIPA